MTCRIIDSLAEISGSYDAILCDLWGCYHNGIEVYPAAVAACQGFRSRGGTVILLTNAPRPAASVERMLSVMTIFSSGDETTRDTAPPENTPWVT